MSENVNSPIEKIAEALSKFQSQMPVLKKTGRNFTKGQAATIGDIVTIAKSGSNFGLSYTQNVNYEAINDSGHIVDYVQTIVMHSPSGQTIQSERYRIIPTKPNDPSAFGAAVTFAKKNQLMAIFGIADHNDDDIDWDVVETEDGNIFDTNKAPSATHSPRTGAVAPQVSSLTPVGAATLDDRIKAAKSEPDLLALFNEVKPTDNPTIQKFSARKKEIANV
jgi:hypothetical protein